jgi:hypothetical protein
VTEHNDPQLNQFVTKVMDMSPEPPAYPGTVVAAPETKKRFPTWTLAPVAAALVLFALIPIGLRSGDGGDESALPPISSTTVGSDLANTEAIDNTSPAPTVDAERNTLTATPSTVAPGSVISIDFTGTDTARSDLWWMDRFDYAAQEWFSGYVMWSDRGETGMSSAEAAVVSVIIPEPNLTDGGPDRLTLPVGIPLGTYRVCTSISDGPCALLEVSDEAAPNTTIPSNDEVIVDEVHTPEFALVHAVPSDATIIATPFAFLIGPDADLVAIADGYIAEGETLPNGFYLRPQPTFGDVELEPSAEFKAFVVDPSDASLAIELSFDEWVAWVLPKPGGTPASDPDSAMYVHLTYDSDGRVLTITEQYIP